MTELGRRRRARPPLEPSVVVWATAISVACLIATEPRTRALMTRLRDGWMIALPHSPLGRFMPGMTMVGFRGRLSGRSVRFDLHPVG